MSKDFITKTFQAKGRDLATTWAAMQSLYDAMEEADPDSTFGTFHGDTYVVVNFDHNNDMGITMSEFAEKLGTTKTPRYPEIYNADKAGVIVLPNGDFYVFGWVVV